MQPTYKSREQKALFSAYIPTAAVPIAWHKPSWAAASGSSLHPVLGPCNNCQR